MKLRKYLVVGAAVLTAGLLTLQTGTAQATGTHGPIHHVAVGATDPITTNVPVSGVFKSGTATFAGFTAGCSGGSVGGNLLPTGAFNFGTLNITCDSPLGIDANISLASGCTVTGTDPRGTGQVHRGLNVATDYVDGMDPKGGKAAPVELGTYTVANQCAVVTISGGCTFRVQGTIDLQFNEVPKASNTLQDLILKGNGLTTSNASFLCFGLIPNGSSITLNNITFNLSATGGLIDYHPAH